MVRAPTCFSDPKRALGYSRHEFDLLMPPQRPRISIRRCYADGLEGVVRFAASAIGGSLADIGAVKRVLQKNPNSVLLFCQGEAIVGAWAMLLLASRGLEALLLDDLDTRNPDPSMLVEATQAPSAIYVWAVVAPPLASEGIRHVSTFLRQPLYAGANLYARSATTAGKQVLSSTGFKSIDQSVDGLHRYVRHVNRQGFLTQAA